MRRPLWILIVSAGVCVGLTLGFRQALGLFLTPISLDMEIGRAMFALSLGLMNLFWGLTAPIAGLVADRLGAGRVAAAGGLCYAAGLVAFTFSGDGDQLILGGISRSQRRKRVKGKCHQERNSQTQAVDM